MLADGPLIVLATHLSARDPLKMILRPFQLVKGVAKKSFFAPMEIGEARRHRLLRKLGEHCAIHSFEVFTDDTPAKLENPLYEKLLAGVTEGQGQKNYLKVARKALKASQMIALTPQGGRRPSLEYSAKERSNLY